MIELCQPHLYQVTNKEMNKLDPMNTGDFFLEGYLIFNIKRKLTSNQLQFKAVFHLYSSSYEMVT